MKALHDTGYSSNDIIGTVFRVCKNQLEVGEGTKLEMIKEVSMRVEIHTGVRHREPGDARERPQIEGKCLLLCACYIRNVPLVVVRVSCELERSSKTWPLELKERPFLFMTEQRQRFTPGLSTLLNFEKSSTIRSVSLMAGSCEYL